ncbi:MAG: RNA 3'-terminal phosphate cyclase [Candidatus Aenigmatarchaeota archaeon]
MIDVDGSYREGGGQIVRTALSLSVYTGKPTRIYRIRANRPTPGLRPQHVKCVETLAELSGAEVEGANKGSEEVEFAPESFQPRDMTVDIGTAGSVTLLLQSLLVPMLRCDRKMEIRIKGGTDVKWSPSVDYIRKILLPILNAHGYDCELELKRRGYYPKGGGEVIFRSKGSDLKRFDLTDRGEIRGAGGISHASNHLSKANVADRQAEASRKALREELEVEPRIKANYCDAQCPGSGIQLWLKTENSLIGGNGLGEKGKPAEKVGRKAAKDLLRNKEVTVDRYAADQLLPFLAIAGGEIKVAEVTDHFLTNRWVVEKFLDLDFSMEEKLIRIS